jgi:hypothetical protein
MDSVEYRLVLQVRTEKLGPDYLPVTNRSYVLQVNEGSGWRTVPSINYDSLLSEEQSEIVAALSRWVART